MTWMRQALCPTRPADWWEVPGAGNRLALLICSVCPPRDRCAAADPTPRGVIRAGVAYGNRGEVLPLCSCGRPTPNVDRLDCFTCVPDKNTPIPASLLHRPAELHATTIRQLLDEGWTYRGIGSRIGSDAEAVRSVARRRGWRSKLVGRPQGSSTVVDEPAA